MADVTKPYTFTNQTTADANQVNQDFDTLYTAVNGGLDNNNIKTGSLSTAIATEGVTQSQTKGVPYAIDLYGGPFLFSGFTVTKDGTTLTQVNVTAGVALTKQSDGNLRRITTSATNFRVATNSATYYLDLNPDGSWWWANSGHSTTANYINVATVTSDASGNVATVTQNSDSSKVNLLSGATGPTNFLRIDSGAPNPQTVSNPVYFAADIVAGNYLGTDGAVNPISQGGSAQGIYFGWNETSSQGEGDIFVYGQAATGGLNVYNTTTSAYPSFAKIFSVDGSGNGTFLGTITVASGKLGSASGTWTPANGTFNVASGTVINIASVPSGAKMFFCETTGGTSSVNSMWGITTPSGSAWFAATNGASQYVNAGHSSAISSATVTGNVVQLFDGTYVQTGYFQINNGYLQFVTTSTGSTSASAQDTIAWGVS